MQDRILIYENQYSIPAPVAGGWCFAVDGDHPAGAEVTYTIAGLTEPLKKPWPITLLTLRAEIVYIATGNQYCGLLMHANSRPNRMGYPHRLASCIVMPWSPGIGWTGELPLDWGYEIVVAAAAGLTTTHMLSIAATYRQRGPM
jgi:hypothetical protein